MHTRDPVIIIEKMSAWTKPGGVVLAQEFDFGAMAVETTCPAMGEFSRVFDAVFRGYGLNMRGGVVNCRRNSRRGSATPTKPTQRSTIYLCRKMATC